MAEIRVRTVGGEYGVFVGRLLYEEKLASMLAEIAPGMLAVVSHPTIMKLHGARLLKALEGNRAKRMETVEFAFPEGEENKSLATLEEGYRFMLDRGVGREDAVLAFGGGVVGDLAGFLASSYMRGIPYLQLPTTLMAMVDSSIGGKVGVDISGAKNAVGAFYQPRAVFCDIDVLGTLPRRELLSGMAEVAKYGFLYESDLLRRMQEWTAAGDGAEKDLIPVISRCAELKAVVVAEDERDLTGRRAMLNYGHTFGHALESSTGYELLRHGEAVALGMIMAARAAELAGLAQSGLLESHVEVLKPLLEELRLPPRLDLDRAVLDMKSDKKRVRKNRFVLLEGPQRPLLVDSLAGSVVREAMQDGLEILKGG